LGETKIILISRRWPQAILQKFQLKLNLLYGKAVNKLFNKNNITK